MRLTDLSPRWLSSDVFSFLCPHCCQVLLTCKRVVLTHRQQCELWREVFGWDEEDNEANFGGVTVVLCKETCAWTISGEDFDTLTVTPSIDASASGHWHGFLTAGQIVGGV